MSNPVIGRLVAGEESQVLKAYEAFAVQPVTDTRLTDNLEPFGSQETTLEGTESAEGVGTFERRRNALLQIGPSTVPGWWIHRTDLNEQLDVKVSVRNVWTSARNIVLRAGSPHNYLRMPSATTKASRAPVWHATLWNFPHKSTNTGHWNPKC